MGLGSQETCSACLIPRVCALCGVCEDPICRKCVLSLDGDAFKFLPKVPEILQKSCYCPPCFDAHVAPAQVDYEGTLDLAKKVAVLSETYRGPIPVLKKAKSEVRVDGCGDRDELILHLAFLAAREGYNALLKTDIIRHKIRNQSSYQTSEWSGSGLPALIDEAKLRVNEEREEMWRRGK